MEKLRLRYKGEDSTFFTKGKIYEAEKTVQIIK